MPGTSFLINEEELGVLGAGETRPQYPKPHFTEIVNKIPQYVFRLYKCYSKIRGVTYFSNEARSISPTQRKRMLPSRSITNELGRLRVLKA